MTSAERSGVLCAGSALVDYGKTIDAYPPLDELATIEAISRSTGGAALNMTRDLRRFGAPFPVELLGCVADDDDGSFILEACASDAIETERVRVRKGDAFAAGVIFGLHEGWSVEAGLRLAAAAAAACIGDPHTSDGIGTVSECLALVERLGCRQIDRQ